MKRTNCSRALQCLLASAAFALAAVPASFAAPPFQAVGLFGDLAVASPPALLSVATYISPDFGFGTVAFVNGLARDPGTGALFIVGTNQVDSFLARVDFQTGAVTTAGTIPGEVVVDLAMDGAGILFALTDNASGSTPHALFRLDKATGAATLLKVLDARGGTRDFGQFGALAWNQGDQSLYYSDLNGASPRRTFIDRLTPGTFAQVPIATTQFAVSPLAMAFAESKLWLSTNAGYFSFNSASPAGGLASEGFGVFPSPDGIFAYRASGMFPAVLPCVPSANAACLAGRFKVEVSYDATPASGAGPATVVLESAKSVKFSFFDPQNIEVVLKVLDACTPPFNRWWVFAGGLTNVGVAIKVTDTKTGAVRNYASTKGTLFQPFADTNAFACP